LKTIYKETFDYFSSPVAVFDEEGRLLYSNKEYEERIKNNQITGATDRQSKESTIFVTEKGVVYCYLVSSDIDSHGNRINTYKDITSFVSRKSMNEIVFSSENKREDYALRKIIQKNLRMSSLIDSLESGVFLEGSSGNLVQLNNSFLKMISSKNSIKIPVGEYNADFYHQILSELIVTDDYYGKKEKIINENSTGVYTDEVKMRDGSVYRRTFRQLYVGSDTKGYLWKFKDITIRKELESFSIELEANIRALESCEMVGIFMEYSGYKFVNKGMEHLLGAGRDEILCKGLNSFFDEDIFSPDGVKSYDKVVRYSSAGSEKYLHLVSDSVTVSGKDAYIVTVIDFTENVLLQKNIERNETRFRNIFEKNLAVMLIMDPENLSIKDANHSAVEFYGQSLEELRGKEMCDLTIVEDMQGCVAKLGHMVQNNVGKRISGRQKTAGGEIREVEMLMTPLESGSDTMLFVIVEDVHDKIHYQHELEDLNKNLIQMVNQEAEKRRRQEELLMEKSRLAEMGEMIANIAHQWRQPLNALGFIIQDIQDASSHGEATEEYLAEVVRNGMGQIEYMSKTIDDFRDFFKPSKSETVFNAKKSISKVLSIFMPQIKHTDIDLSIECHCAEGKAVYKGLEDLDICAKEEMLIKGYENQFKQVLLNLLSNSKDALADLHNKKIIIKVIPEAEKIKIVVEDNGGGIPDNIMTQIFDPYFTTKSETGGTGIGLYMSKAIVEDNLGGSLSVENTEEGCRFTVEVDRVKR